MKKIPNELFFSWVDAEIAEGHSVQFRVKGNSMFPLLRNGCDQVVISPCNAQDIKPMDIVLFRYRGGHILHRVLRREENRLYIQGDGSYVATEECCTSDVVGIVRIVVRQSGKRISTDSRHWQIVSRLWRCTGIFRGFLLRVLHCLLDK